MIGQKKKYLVSRRRMLYLLILQLTIGLLNLVITVNSVEPHPLGVVVTAYGG